MKKLHLFVLCAVFLLAACLTGVLVSCQDGQTETSSATGTGTSTEPQGSAFATDTEPETEPVTAPGTDTETDMTTETDTETETETETEGIKLNIKADALNPLMTSLWSGDEVRNETVMFLDAGEAKSLLYRADCILSVTGYDGKRKYTEGVDYALQDGKIVALEGGALPTITSAKYYGADSTSLLMTKYNGKNVYTHWGEGRAMTDWQVNVTYTHSDSWEGYRQTCEIGQFAGLVDKLNRGEDVTFIFYGDSITNGASASFVYNYAPQQYSYPLLLTQALADLFGYNVHYVQTGLNGTSRIPNQDYTVENVRGTITYINPAIGGWNTQQGLDNYDSHVKPFIEQYGCDLFVLAFGMNDAGGDRGNAEEDLKQGAGAVVRSRIADRVHHGAQPGRDQRLVRQSGKAAEEPSVPGGGYACAERFLRRGVHDLGQQGSAGAQELPGLFRQQHQSPERFLLARLCAVPAGDADRLRQHPLRKNG